VKLLLDTHTLLWWLDGDTKLSRKVRLLIADNENDVYVSAASVWEIATKARLGKLPQALSVAHRLTQIVAEQGFLTLDITIQHGQHAGSLASEHRDPFDRMLAAQAQLSGMPIATKDVLFAGLSIGVIW
jgi:PIN domain nuclease of toxin-antitoxin system